MLESPICREIQLQDHSCGIVPSWLKTDVVDRFIDWFCELRIRAADAGYDLEWPTVSELLWISKAPSTFR